MRTLHDCARAVRPLLSKLGNRRAADRQRAREDLVAIGEPAVPGLIGMLSSPARMERWEAAKALAEIAEPTSAAALVRSLEDDDGDVRWIAAEGLIALGRHALVPLLEALITRTGSPWILTGAHHILIELRKQKGLREVEPVLEALAGPAREVAAPVAAWHELQCELYADAARLERVSV